MIVKVLCQEIVLQFVVFTDDRSWDGNVPDTRVLIMSSTSVLGEVRVCYDYEYDCELEFEFEACTTLRYDPILWREDKIGKCENRLLENYCRRPLHVPILPDDWSRILW